MLYTNIECQIIVIKHMGEFRGKPNLDGRKVGAKNKLGIEVKKSIADILENNTSEFMERMSNLNDAEYCKIYLQLAKFVIPTMRSVDAPITNKLPFDKVEIEIIGRNGRL